MKKKVIVILVVALISGGGGHLLFNGSDMPVCGLQLSDYAHTRSDFFNVSGVQVQ